MVRRSILLAGGCLAFLCLAVTPECLSEGRDLCIYRAQDGSTKQVVGREQVPLEQQGAATCFTESRRAKNSIKTEAPSAEIVTAVPKKGSTSVPGNGYMANPEDIKLKGTVRREDMASAMGRIELRWPRKVELLFGRTPVRAMQDAAMAVSRALKTSGFPAELQHLSLDWKVVFMDEDLPETQIPTYLVSNCHPAWMTPPSNLYVVAQRVVAGCNNTSSQSMDARVADSQLAHILIHEMGHAVEYQLLKDQFGQDRMRAEGFASWFEQYGSEYSAVIRKGSIKNMYFGFAREAIRKDPDSFNFQGSVYDYARASMYFHAIASKRGLRSIVDVYRNILQQKITFMEAVSRTMGWDQAELNQQVLKVLK